MTANSKEIVPAPPAGVAAASAVGLAGAANALALAGLQANKYAQSITLQDYQQGKDKDYLKSQSESLKVFIDFLAEIGVIAGDLVNDLAAWRGLTHGLVLAFKHWLLQAGYAQGSIRVRLSAVKIYAELAMKAGYIPPDELTLIKTVHAHRGKEARNIDLERETTRIGNKHEEAPLLTDEQVRALKDQPKWRDALLMCLLLDHGLRCGEVAGLTIDGLKVHRQEFMIDGQLVEQFSGFLTFYREKVDKTQTHRLSPQTARAAWYYLQVFGGKLHVKLFSGRGSAEWIEGTEERGYSKRAIHQRVAALARNVALDLVLSPHDCRHNWATRVARSKPNMRQFQEAGGWNSPAMPMYYAQAASIANDGIAPVELTEVDLVA